MARLWKRTDYWAILSGSMPSAPYGIAHARQS